jgi:pilus assembly protein Flp/PilA
MEPPSISLPREQLAGHVSIAPPRHGAKRAEVSARRRCCGVTKEEDMVRFALMYVRSFVRDEEAQDLVEYALLVGLIVLGAVTLLTNTGNQIENIFTTIVSSLTSANANASGNAGS